MAINVMKHKILLTIEYTTAKSSTDALTNVEKVLKDVVEVPFIHNPIKIKEFTHVDTSLVEV